MARSLRDGVLPQCGGGWPADRISGGRSSRRQCRPVIHPASISSPIHTSGPSRCCAMRHCSSSTSSRKRSRRTDHQGCHALQHPVRGWAAEIHRHRLVRGLSQRRAMDRVSPIHPSVPVPVDASGLGRRPLPALAPGGPGRIDPGQMSKLLAGRKRFNTSALLHVRLRPAWNPGWPIVQFVRI